MYTNWNLKEAKEDYMRKHNDIKCPYCKFALKENDESCFCKIKNKKFTTKQQHITCKYFTLYDEIYNHENVDDDSTGYLIIDSTINNLNKIKKYINENYTTDVLASNWAEMEDDLEVAYWKDKLSDYYSNKELIDMVIKLIKNSNTSDKIDDIAEDFIKNQNK